MGIDIYDGYSYEEDDDPRTWVDTKPVEIVEIEISEDDFEVDTWFYWDSAEELVNAWSYYQAKRKLLQNLVDDNTRHVVGFLLDEEYQG